MGEIVPAVEISMIEKCMAYSSELLPGHGEPKSWQVSTCHSWGYWWIVLINLGTLFVNVSI